MLYVKIRILQSNAYMCCARCCVICTYVCICGVYVHVVCTFGNKSEVVDYTCREHVNMWWLGFKHMYVHMCCLRMLCTYVLYINVIMQCISWLYILAFFGVYAGYMWSVFVVNMLRTLWWDCGWYF